MPFSEVMALGLVLFFVWLMSMPIKAIASYMGVGLGCVLIAIVWLWERFLFGVLIVCLVWIPIKIIQLFLG